MTLYIMHHSNCLHLWLINTIWYPLTTFVLLNFTWLVLTEKLYKRLLSFSINHPKLAKFESKVVNMLWRIHVSASLHQNIYFLWNGIERIHKEWVNLLTTLLWVYLKVQFWQIWNKYNKLIRLLNALFKF